ncbi:hypothetical protein [Rubritalea marina]|uniref:hypothetical protein n=1 Tax=Rubritalea marina TaxID=361055 RepID=UPI0003814635|nr:hypothetical protein [Rubritalea marina]
MKQEDIQRVLEHTGFDLDRLIDDLSEEVLRDQFVSANDDLKIWQEVPDASEIVLMLKDMRARSEIRDSDHVLAQYLSDEYLNSLQVDKEHLPEAQVLEVEHTQLEGAQAVDRVLDSSKESADFSKEVTPSAPTGPTMAFNPSTAVVSKVAITEVSPHRKPSTEREFRATRKLEEILEQEEIEPHHTARTMSTSDRNEGISPSSPKFIRGVLHRNADRMMQGTSAFILVLILSVVSIFPVVYAFFWSDYYYALLCPALLFIAICLQFTIVRHSNCPVCRQRQYVTKRCAKHKRAHFSPVFGHRIPTAIHLMRFKWFRCIYCGTAVRVKE